MRTFGMLYPGTGAEDDYPYLSSLLGDDEIVLVETSIGEDAHTIEALRETGRSERLLAGAEELRPHRVASVMWACTSGSFVFGVAGAKAQAAAVGHALGVPASSTSLAFTDALRALGFTKVGVSATYPDELAGEFQRFLVDDGFEVLSFVSNGVPSAVLAGELDEDHVVAMARSCLAPGVQAVLLPDTALHTARSIRRLEAELGLPVLTANQVTVWQGLRLAGANRVVPELGWLFGHPENA